jgi:hypothetical protein
MMRRVFPYIPLSLFLIGAQTKRDRVIRPLCIMET